MDVITPILTRTKQEFLSQFRFNSGGYLGSEGVKSLKVIGVNLRGIVF